MRVLAAFFFNVACNFAIGLLVAKFLGPAEYGRFALAFAVAAAVQTAFFDCLRLGTVRFYSERTRTEEPAVRATLDMTFIVTAFAITIAASLFLMSGVHFTLSNGLIALALIVAISNGIFDYSTALVRARFHDRLYTRLILVKNILALFLTGGGAFVFGSAKMALIGSIISMSGAVVTARAALHDPSAKRDRASMAIAKSLFSYTLPVVLANVLYASIPLANRSIIAALFGFSATGQFSLAYDLGSKAILAIGSALDVVLFQIAVALHDEHGPGKARVQMARNMSIVFAIVLPACTGIWLTLPSIEHVVVPLAYRGPFAALLTLMMTGLFAGALIQFAITPLFMIGKRTMPLIAGAIVACIANPIFIFILPRNPDASSFAIAQSGAYLIALIALVAMASFSKPQWPRLRDPALTAVGTAAMAAALLPLREYHPGFLILATQVAAGVLVYGLFVYLFDIANLREIAIARIRPLVARLQASS